MAFNDTYQTISKPAEGVYKDRGSKFLAYAYPLSSDSEVKEIIAALKSQHTQARHHCWALRLSHDTSVWRIQDDGEPSGTAGRPILNTLLSFGLTDIMVVVVRYFGGTLLGVPGLIHAYKQATVDALSNAEIIEKTINSVYDIRFAYSTMNDVMRVIKNESLNIRDQQYDNICTIRLEIRQSAEDRVLERLGKIEGLKYDFILLA